MDRRTFLAGTGLGAATSMVAAAQSLALPDPLPEEQFRRLHAAVLPGAEKWAKIRWETDLSAARRRAIQDRKPLLLWIKDGHPLGCT